MWYELFNKLKNLSEGFGKHTPMVHEDMPDEIRKLVHGALYHLDPAKILRVKRMDEEGWWEVNIHTYQKISHKDTQDYLDNIFTDQLKMHSDADYDVEWPSYRYEAGDNLLDIYISYEDPDEAELDDPPEEKPQQPEYDKNDKDSADWWKAKASDKVDSQKAGDKYGTEGMKMIQVIWNTTKPSRASTEKALQIYAEEAGFNIDDLDWQSEGEVWLMPSTAEEEPLQQFIRGVQADRTIRPDIVRGMETQ